jgi:hypothetical protein
VGAIFTDGDPLRAGTSRTYGADLRLATARFLGGSRNFAFHAYGLKTSNQGVSGKDASYGMSVEYPNDLFNELFFLRDTQENFRPAMGFVTRTNVRFLNSRFLFQPRPKDFLNVRQMYHKVFYSRYSRLDTGEVESWRLQTSLVQWDFNSGENIEFNWGQVFDRLFEPFEISPDVILPVGEYRITRWRIRASTASKRRVDVLGEWDWGTFWSGNSDEVRMNLNIKFPPRLQLGWTMDQTFARLPEGNFVVRLFRMEANYSLSPFVSFANLVQYDNESRNLGWQSRFRWILRPGNDLFLVFDQGWQQEALGGFRLHAADTRLAGKVQYTFRF